MATNVTQKDKTLNEIIDISRSSATNSRTAPEHIGSSSLRRIRNEQG